MKYLDDVTFGAKLREAHALIERLHEQHPNATKEEAFELFKAQADEAMYSAVVQDVVTDYLREVRLL